MIPLSGLDLREQLFTWENPENASEQITWAVDRLAVDAEKHTWPVILMAIDPNFAEQLPVMRDLEAHRLTRLLELGIENWQPVLVCMMPDNTGNIVDGNHRLFIAHKLGLTEIRARIIPESIWREYVVDMPANLSLTGWSGI